VASIEELLALISTICYLLACLTLDIASNVDIAFTFNVSTPTQCISSIAVGRMMMNIRGLILDDSERTVHLPTLQFAARINAGSEVEERTEARHRFF